MDVKNSKSLKVKGTGQSKLVRYFFNKSNPGFVELPEHYLTPTSQWYYTLNLNNM